ITSRPSPCRVCAAGDDAEAGDQNNPGTGRIQRKASTLVADISFVLLAVPVRVRGDAGAESISQLRGSITRRIELDRQWLVFRVDQVIGARRADLTDFGGDRKSTRLNSSHQITSYA